MLELQPFDANRRWYDRYSVLQQAALQVAYENINLRRRIHEVEERLAAVELTPEHLYDLGSGDLTRLASHYHSLVKAIVAELRARHRDVAEELLAPQARTLEDELAAPKAHACQTHQHLRDQQQESPRRMGVRTARADVQQEDEEASAHV
jgi:hypothetical protein